MLIKSLFPVFVLLVVIFQSCPVLAWGANGHRVIGAIAEQHLTAAAKAAVREFLEGETLAEASTWADEMRSSRNNADFWNNYASSWHYVNVAPGRLYDDSPKSPRGDALMALEVFTAILLDAPIPDGPVKEGLENYFGSMDDHNPAVLSFALDL